MIARDELLDISVHALTALMNTRSQTEMDELVNESVSIAIKLIDKVTEVMDKQ